MASFKEQYDSLFGPTPPYDPIKLRKRTAINANELLAEAPDASPDAGADLLLPDIPVRGTSEGDTGVLENVGRQIGAGTVQIGEMGLDAAGWLARKTPITDGIVSDAIYSMRDGLTSVREDILAGIDEEGRQKAAAEFLTLDPNRTIWQGNPLDFAEAVLYKAANALPATIATLAPPIAFARAGMTAKAIASMGATEGVLSLGGIAGGIRDEINALDTETLMSESPRFVQLLEESGGDADYAREQLITEAQGYAPLIGGATVGAISSVAGRYFTPIFEKGGGAALGSRAGRGFAAEFPQEASQGASEQLVQNYAAKIYDLDRQLSEGVAEASVQEGVIGGTMGAGAGALFGQRPQRPAPPRTAIDLDARPEITEQMDFGGDLAPGGPDPNILPDELDQPSAEPPGDLQAQMEDLIAGNRDAVYISPDQDPRTYSVPDTLIEMEDVDGRGGSLIVRDEQTALDARARISQGESRQAVIGSLVGAGEGKPTNPASRVVQLLDEQGNVVRESVVATPAEAEALGVAWSKEKENKGRRVAIMSPREALERRKTLGQEATIPIQEDLFDNTAARSTEGEMVPEVLDQPVQGELPLTNQRERGVGRTLEDVDRPAALPDDTTQEEFLQPPDQAEIDRRQFGMDFSEAGVETVNRRSTSTKKTGKFLVRMYDDEGNVIHEEVKNSPVGADTAADALAADFPDANIQVVPQTEADVQVETRARKRKQPVVEPEYQGSIEEEVRDDIRANVPFEERAEPISEVKGSRSYGQAADKLISAAAAEYEAEAKTRIEGFDNPDTLTFDNPEYEADYRETWDQLLDEEIRFEMTGTKTKKREALLQELGRVRQVAKPKKKPGKAEKYLKAARAVNPAAVDEFERSRTVARDKPIREAGPQEYGTPTTPNDADESVGALPVMTREEIDALEGRDLDIAFEQAAIFREGREASTRPAPNRKKQTIPTVVYQENGKKQPKITRAFDTEAEARAFQQELRDRGVRRAKYEAREVKAPRSVKEKKADSIKVDETVEKTRPLDPRKLTISDTIDDEGEFVGEAESNDVVTGRISPTIDRKEFDTPGKKKKFIRREVEHLRRRVSGQRSVKATEVASNKGKGRLKSDVLTQENYPLDESVSDRLKRQKDAKETLSALGKAATKVNMFMRKAGIRKGTGDTVRAREFVRQLVMLARSMQASKSQSNQMISQAKKLMELLDSVPSMTEEDFSKKFAAIARNNEKLDLDNLKWSDLSTMRIPEKRAEATEDTNRGIVNKLKRRELQESYREDGMFNRMIKPVLSKMSDSIISAISAEGGGNVYLPNAAEIAELRFALNMNLDKYQDVRDTLKRVGFQFDSNGYLRGFEPSGDYLNIQTKSKFGSKSSMVVENPPTAADIDREMNRNIERAEQEGKRERWQNRQAAALYDKVNGLIDRFQKAVASNKTTISGIKRQEARFIRGLKKLGVWRQTGSNTGVIDIAGVSTKTYVMVSERVGRGKTLSKPQALEIIRRIRQLPIPRAVQPFIRETRTPEFAAGVERFLDENATELFLEAAKPVQYDTEYTSVAESVGNQLIDGTVNGTDVVNTILQLAPQNSFYRNLADRLRRYDMSGVKVAYGTEEDFPSGQPGKFLRKTNTILINRDGLRMGQLTNDEVAGARVVHTLTHELIHAVTHMNVTENASLRRYMEGLRDRAREVWQRRVGRPLPYGLKVLEKSENEIHEFIAEAFSNHEFQNFLKDTPREPNTIGDLWRAFANGVRRVLGLPEVAPSNNLFDAILMSEDILFDDAGFGGGVEGDLYITGEAYIDNISTFVQDKAAKSFEWLGKAKDAGRNLMTFDQLYDAYSKYFTDGSFTRYMDAFKRRNSAISARMKVPEKLSTRWTKLEAENPDAALELSRIGTAATIHRMTPSKQLTAKERSEVSEKRLKRYDALRARYLAMPKDARDLYDDIRQYYKDAQAEEANLLLEAGLRGILTKGETKMMTTEEFRQKFPREVVEKFSQREDIVEALKEFIPEENLKGIVTQVQRLAHLRTISVGDYFPLMRYGDYTVYKKVSRPDEVFSDYGKAMARRKEILEADPTLEVGVYTEGERHILRVDDVEFWMFESKTEAQKKADELGEFVEARHSRKKNNMAIASNAELITVLTALKGNPAAQTAIKEHYLRSLADQSFRKSELRRKNTKGVNYDIQHRNLANYLKSSAYYRAQLEHGWRMGEALQEMQEFTRGRPDGGITTEQLGRVVQNVEARDAMTNDAGELNKLVRSGVNLTQFMMLTSPSYWMINATQPWLVTAPIMGGKHGIGNSYAALKHALGLVKSPLTKEAWESKFGLSAFTDPVKTENAFNVVDQLIEHLKGTTDPRKDEYIELINDLRDINIIDINVLTELRQIADGVEGKLGTKILDASRILAHITEVNNRVVTAIAAYNLEMNKSGDKEAAKKYAADMISQTQFNYSSENKPPLFQPGGPLKWAAPLMFQFMQWPQHMYALLIRNVHGAVKGESKEARRVALKSLTGLLATHAAVGGVTGMALQPIKWAFGMLMFAFGDDDEPYTFANAINGRTFDNLIQEVATEALGPTLGRAVGSGLPTLLGTDLSARMSMGTLYFVDLRGDTAESILGSLVASFGGATLNQAMNWGNALGKMADGEIYRGAEQAMPKILRDVMRAGRYYNEGLVNNAGDTVIPTEDLSFAEVFLQGIGFSPDEVSRHYQGQAAIKGAQGYARDRRESLVREFVEEGNRSDILREVQEFNRAYPSLRISRSTLIRAARSQIERESRYGRYGANIDDKEARDFKDYGKPYR